MRKVLLILVTAIGFGISTNAQVSNSRNNTDQIIGVWKYAGEYSGLEVKCIITKSHYVTIYLRNNVIIASFGGTCSFDGETFIETIQFGTQGYEGKIGQIGTFKIKFEGKRINKSGVLYPSNARINEFWERVE